MPLSIDLRVQAALEDEVAKAAQTFGAKGAVGLVTNVHTGEILGMTSWPSFDPNDAGKADPNALVNRAAARVYEMGSTFKTFSIAMALDSGKVRMDSTFDTSATMTGITGNYDPSTFRLTYDLSGALADGRWRVVTGTSTLADLAGSPPKKQSDLARVRGLSGAWAGNDIGGRLMAALADAVPLPLEEMPDRDDRKPGLGKEGALVADLLKLLLKIRAREIDVAPKLLARSDDLEALAAGKRVGLPILEGWRYDQFGHDALQVEPLVLTHAVLNVVAGERDLHRRNPQPARASGVSTCSRSGSVSSTKSGRAARTGEINSSA